MKLLADVSSQASVVVLQETMKLLNDAIHAFKAVSDTCKKAMPQV